MTIKPSTFRPLLSAAIENATEFTLRYPLIASPKIDGIRVICHPQLGPVTRSLKPVKNHHIRTLLSDPKLSGLDGEVVVGPITAKDVFQKTTTGVMTVDGTPSFTYHVFDDVSDPTKPYNVRMLNAEKRVRALPDAQKLIVIDHEWWIVINANEVLNVEIKWLADGFEGIMLRCPNAPYKFGRSTLKEQTLIKLKRFADAEATIVGFEPLLRNENPQTRDLLGLAERSDHKSGKREVQTLGNLLVRHHTTNGEGGFGEFAIGSGFDQSLREHIWSNRSKYLGATVTFKYQQIGIKDKPRFPIFKGFRPQE